MKSIIEKLGIKGIDLYSPKNTYIQENVEFVCDSEDVDELEKQRNEMLEALIEICLHIEWRHSSTGGFGTYGPLYSKAKKIIEKADPQHRTWEEIKELL